MAFAFPCAAPEAAKETVARLAREHHDATHVAFAWTIGAGDSARSRSSDAGEPSGTAGKPIAAAIESAGLCDVLVAVVRHFGGTKLGTAGLARAYREAASRALSAAGARLVYETQTVAVTCPYTRLSAVKKLIRPPGIEVLAEEFGADSRLTLSVRRFLVPELIARLDAERLSYRLVTET